MDNPSQDDLENRVRAEMLDTFDEELEMEIDDARLAELVDSAAGAPG